MSSLELHLDAAFSNAPIASYAAKLGQGHCHHCSLRLLGFGSLGLVLKKVPRVGLEVHSLNVVVSVL